MYLPSLGITICGFQGMGVVIALVRMRNMARTQQTDKIVDFRVV